MANNELAEDWSNQLVRRVGRAVKEARGEGRSAKWLAERTAELGYPVSATVIAKLDSGHRGSHLQVSELLVLAAALGVPPLLLLYPEVPDGEVEVLPGMFMSSEEAIQWACGEKQHLGGRDRDGNAVFRTTSREPVELLKVVKERREMAGLDLAFAADLDKVHADYRDQELMARIRKEFEDHDRQIGLIENRIRELGGTIIDPEPQSIHEGEQPPF